MTEVKFIIPTYKRWERLRGVNAFPFARWCCPESQAEQYSKVLKPEQIITLPDDMDGNIARKRNWILRNVPRPLVMLDDDVSGIWMWENRTSQTHKRARYGRFRLSPEDVQAWAAQTVEVVQELGTVFWGVAQNYDDRVYKEWCPFSMTAAALGPLSGHLEHDLEYDERLWLKEDYDFNLQVFLKYKAVFRWNKYYYHCDHGDNQGGVVGQRTEALEREHAQRIMRKWGRNLISYELDPKKVTDYLNGRLRVPIKGV